MSLLNNMFGSGAQNSILGTSEDEMYRNHIDHLRVHEEELMRQKYAMQSQMLQAQMQQAQIANSSSYLHPGQYNTAIGQQTLRGAKAMKPFNPNELEAYKIAFSQLVTLWQAKYGDEWVETAQEEFWQHALKRLSHAGKMEHVNGWYRIKEDA